MRNTINYKNYIIDISYGIEKGIFFRSPIQPTNVLCSPIYFKRHFRKLSAVSTDKDSKIQYIWSYGYGNYNYHHFRECDKEITHIGLNGGTCIEMKRSEKYHYTHEDIIKKIIDTQEIE